MQLKQLGICNELFSFRFFSYFLFLFHFEFSKLRIWMLQTRVCIVMFKIDIAYLHDCAVWI